MCDIIGAGVLIPNLYYVSLKTKQEKKNLMNMDRSVEAAPESRKAGLELIGRTL